MKTFSDPGKGKSAKVMFEEGHKARRPDDMWVMKGTLSSVAAVMNENYIKVKESSRR